MSDASARYERYEIRILRLIAANDNAELMRAISSARENLTRRPRAAKGRPDTFWQQMLIDFGGFVCVCDYRKFEGPNMKMELENIRAAPAKYLSIALADWLAD